MVGDTLKLAVEQPSAACVVVVKAKIQMRESGSSWAKNFKALVPPLRIWRGRLVLGTELNVSAIKTDGPGEVHSRLSGPAKCIKDTMKVKLVRPLDHAHSNTPSST